MHHIPPYGDPLHLGVFMFRVLAGACFGLLFWFRGFAIAVYTHALYDLTSCSSADDRSARTLGEAPGGALAAEREGASLLALGLA